LIPSDHGTEFLQLADISDEQWVAIFYDGVILGMYQNTYLERGVMKFRKILLSLMVLDLVLPLFTVSANASSKKIPKNLRGTWVSKAQYNSKHHSKKTLWLPKMRVRVYNKTVKWQFKGTLPTDGGHYDHKVYTIKTIKSSHGLTQLTGHTIFTHWNFLSRHGKELDYGWQNGGDLFMTRAK